MSATHTHTQASYWQTSPWGRGLQMGLEIVSTLSQICRALIGCSSFWPLTFWHKWPQRLRQREISHQVLFSKRIQCTDSCCRINGKAMGGRILLQPLIFWDLCGILLRYLLSYSLHKCFMCSLPGRIRWDLTRSDGTDISLLLTWEMAETLVSGFCRANIKILIYGVLYWIYV